MTPADPKPPRRPPRWLSEDDRAAIFEAARRHPKANPGRLAKIVQAAGIPAARGTIRQLLRHGMPPTGINARGYMLSDAQRDLLRELLREDGPRANRSHIARSFELLTGRPISAMSVGRFARDELGYPPLPRGFRPGDRRVTIPRRSPP